MRQSVDLGNLAIPPTPAANTVYPDVCFDGQIYFDEVTSFSISSQSFTMIFHDSHHCTLTVKSTGSQERELIFTFGIIELIYLFRLLVYIILDQNINEHTARITIKQMSSLFTAMHLLIFGYGRKKDYNFFFTLVPLHNSRRLVLASGLGIHYITTSLANRYAKALYDLDESIHRVCNIGHFVRKASFEVFELAPAVTYHQQAHTRLQIHGILIIPLTKLSDYQKIIKYKDELRKAERIGKSESDLLVNFNSLPTELQLYIVSLSQPLHGLKCECHSLVCTLEKHNERCRRSRSYFSSHVDLLFLVNGIKCLGTDRKEYMVWYCILTTQNLHDHGTGRQPRQDGTTLHSRLLENCMVMDACHLQSSIGFLSLKSDTLLFHDGSNGKSIMLRPAYESSFVSISDMQHTNKNILNFMECPHRGDFVPKSHSQKDHILLFS
jgi:hypothetical protein